MSKVDLSEFLPPYLAEVDELLAVSRKNLLAAETAAKAGGHNAFAVRELFRAIHTIKGLSAMIEVEPIVSVTHEMESCLRAADRAGGHLTLTTVEPLLEGLRAVEQRVNALAAGQKVSAAPSALLDRLRELVKPEAARPTEAAPAKSLQLDADIHGRLTPSERTQLQSALTSGRRAVRLDFAPSPERASEGHTINSVRDRLKVLGELVKVVPQHAAKTAERPAGLVFMILLVTDATDEVLLGACPCAVSSVWGDPSEAPVTPLPASITELELGAAVPEAEEQTDSRSGGVVRVPAERLDDALERLSAMFVGRSRLNRALGSLTSRGVDTRELAQLLGEHTRQLRDLRASFLRLRMVPVSQVLQGLPLVIRGLQRTTGKQVALELDFGRAEIDKAVGDRLIPAIVHLARNAVDHAVESPEARKRLGKPPVAALRVGCHERSSTQLELTVTDDGSGIDAEALARRAGVPIPETNAALLELLCRPGLSTRSSADTTSGRGMGMDIVKGIVDGLGGELSLKTAPHQGTTFTLRVPLTITIVDALVFECGGQNYAVPLAAVEELVELDVKRLIASPSPGRGGFEVSLMERRGVAVPVFGLSSAMGLPMAALGTRALVVRQGDEPIAFAVDRMVGQQEIVVRPLDDALVKVAGIAGAADLGDGKPTLVLDLLALGAAVLSRSQVEHRS